MFYIYDRVLDKMVLWTWILNFIFCSRKKDIINNITNILKRCRHSVKQRVNRETGKMRLKWHAHCAPRLGRGQCVWEFDPWEQTVVVTTCVWGLSQSPYMKLEVTLAFLCHKKNKNKRLKRARISAYISGLCKAVGLSILLFRKCTIL